MKTTCFKRCGWAYRPLRWSDVAITLLTVIFSWAVHATTISKSRPVSYSLYNMFVYPTCGLFWWK